MLIVRLLEENYGEGEQERKLRGFLLQKVKLVVLQGKREVG